MYFWGGRGLQVSEVLSEFHGCKGLLHGCKAFPTLQGVLTISSSNSHPTPRQPPGSCMKWGVVEGSQQPKLQ